MKTVLRNFLDGEGKLTAFPAKRKMKVYALFYLAEVFKADRSYTEAEVNDLLRTRHTFNDPATLRRELYDYHFLDRSPDGRTYCIGAEKPSLEDLEL